MFLRPIMRPYFSVSGEAGEKWHKVKGVIAALRLWYNVSIFFGFRRSRREKWHKIQCIIAALRLLYYACAYRVNSHLSRKRLCPVAAAVLRPLAAMAGIGCEGTSPYRSPPPAMIGADFFLSPLAEI